jgi:hypothetical protein
MLQHVCLLHIKDAGGQVLGVAHLELHEIFASLDFHRGSTLPSCSKEEVLDLMDLLRLQQQVECNQRMAHTSNHSYNRV